MSKGRNFLVEIGTEELPPKALRTLMNAFAENLEAAVDQARLDLKGNDNFAIGRNYQLLDYRSGYSRTFAASRDHSVWKFKRLLLTGRNPAEPVL